MPSSQTTNEEIGLHSPDFIPYACHYDLETILTKNGNLLQVIEIKGFSHNTKDEVDLNIRALIRQSILKNTKFKNLSVYFHTIRQSRNLDQSSKFSGYFSKKLHEAWVQINYWDAKYVNNLYITIVSAGPKLSTSVLDLFSVRFLSKKQDNYLKLSSEELSKTTNNILKDLEGHGAVKLSIVNNEQKGYCSEIMRFFNKIIHLEEIDFPVRDVDLSKELTKYKIIFGDNVLRIQKQNSIFFSAILSIKENAEIPPEVLGSFLQLPYQMVITQSITFANTKLAMNTFKHQDYILDVSRDQTFMEQSGLEEARNVKPDDYNAFCRVQTTVMITSTNLDKLRADVAKVYKNLCDLGIPTVQEDLNMEHCFWAQLPANLSYSARTSISLSSKMGAFALLNNCPFGSLKGKWEEPITILTTSLGTPYFFHFHVDNIGHTIIVGDDDAAKMALLNFLLSETSKFNPRFLYLDAYRQSELFLKAMGIEYAVFSFDATANTLQLNPLLLEDTPANRSFLCYWFLFLLNFYANASNYKTYIPVLNKAIEVIFSLPKEKRKICNVAEFFVDPSTEALNEEIVETLRPWYGEGNWAHIFDNDKDFLIDRAQSNLGIETSALYDTSMRVNLPIITYILHFFKEYFTGKAPALLPIRWSNRLFNSIYFEKNLEYILKDLAKKNAVCMFTASFCSKTVNWSEKVGKIYSKIMETKIFMADNAPSYANMIKLFDFSKEEEMYLQSLSIESHQFLLKQGQYSTIMKLDLTPCDKELAILSGNSRYVTIMETLEEEKGERDPKVWLSELYEKIDDENEQ